MDKDKLNKPEKKCFNGDHDLFLLCENGKANKCIYYETCYEKDVNEKHDQWQAYHDQEMQVKDAKWMEFIKPILDVYIDLKETQVCQAEGCHEIEMWDIIKTLAEKMQDKNNQICPSAWQSHINEHGDEKIEGSFHRDCACCVRPQGTVKISQINR